MCRFITDGLDSHNNARESPEETMLNREPGAER